MKIGIITDSYYPQLNGVVIAVDNFARELRKLGHEVYIFAPLFKNYKDKDKNIFRISSFKVLSSEPEVMFPLPMSKNGYKQIFNMDLDIIHAHGNGAFSFLGSQIGKLRGIPFVLTFHTVHTKYTHYFLNGKVIRPKMVALGLRMFADICDGIITPSEKMKNALMSWGVKKEIKIIPNFIDFAHFQKNKKGYLHKRFSIPRTDKILLTVGRLGKEKNFPFLINMLKKLVKTEQNTHLVIVGQGGELGNLKDMVEKFGLSKNVHFTQKVEAEIIQNVYSDADIFVFASTTEAHPVVILEAAAAGLPLVLVNDPAYKNMIIDGETGYSLPQDTEIFAQKIKQLLRDNALRQRFGKKAREMIENNFRRDQITGDLVEYYKEVIAAYKPGGEILRKINRATLTQLFRATNAINKFLNS